jgi:choline dehydrogenase-like flavoprotein
MLGDARELAGGENIQADVCVVGAGAAGITFAREFIGSAYRVVVLESGGLEFDSRTQQLYEGTNVGLPTFGLEVNRLRYFGGTTNHWAGHSRRLDAIDFVQRASLPMSGWPIERSDLDPYYDRAERVCELSSFDGDDVEGMANRLGLPLLGVDAQRLKSVVYKQSPPTRFGTVYREELRRARNVEVLLHANVVKFDTDPGGNVVRTARIACLDGPRFTVSARFFVLATGAMENVRLLLHSNDAVPDGLGNGNGLVGRYFQDHVLLRPAALAVLFDPGVNLQLYDRPHELDGGGVFGVVAPAESAINREGIGNFRIHLLQGQMGKTTAEASARALSSALSERRYRVARAHLRNVVSDLDGLFESTYQCFFGDEASLAGKVYVSVGCYLVLEPQPNFDSRIRLSDDRDALGLRRLEVDWRLTDADLRGARRAIELLGLEIGRQGLGRVYGPILDNGSEWPDNLEAGKHHCGTTRMAAEPRLGVVDENCRVFGTSNMYVTGSSVFPTIGYANPTLTIVALTLRLAEHIDDKLS